MGPEYFVVTGSSGKVQLFTRDGIFLGDLVDPGPKDEYNSKVGCTYDANGNPLESIDANNWTWSIAVRPKSNGV